MRKKIIIVPHTHWDKEWFLTSATTDLMLQRQIEGLINSKLPFHFDGHTFALDDYLQTSSLDPSIIAKIKQHQITFGPLYCQADFMNTMFGTTQRNFDYGKELTRQFSTLPNWVYVADSFGFPEQLPQILKHNNYQYFTAWRGIKASDIKISPWAKWKGIDGSMVNLAWMPDGYSRLGKKLNYQWPQDTKKQEQQSQEYALKHFFPQIAKLVARKKQNVYWIPLGRDWGVYPHFLDQMVSHFNKMQNDWFFVIGTLEDFLSEIDHQLEQKIIDYPLFYSGVSKIHRTVASNRYDLKVKFRSIEHALYYQMEPLEIMFKQFGGKCLSKKYKDQKIYKPLLQASAHDALAGTNDDRTNFLSLARLISIEESVKTYIDLMLRVIQENLNLKPNQYLIINQAPFKQDIIIEEMISTNSSQKINYYHHDISIIEFAQEDLTHQPKKVNTYNDFAHDLEHPNVINHYVYLQAKNMEPMSYQIIDFTKIESSKLADPIISFKDSTITLHFAEKKINFKLLIDENLGDEFDFSTNKKAQQVFAKDFELSKSNKEGNLVSQKMIIKGVFKSIPFNFKLFAIKSEEQINLKIETQNNLKNARISLQFIASNVELSRHLAFVNQWQDQIDDWQAQNYFDAPVNHWPNDGLVRLDQSLNIFTQGVNEVELNNSQVNLVLARSSDLIGKPETDYRPGIASGTPHILKTEDAQLLKKLTFNLMFSFKNPIEKLNNWYFKGVGKQAYPTNTVFKRTDYLTLIPEKLDLSKKILFTAINHKSYLIGLYYFDSAAQLCYAYANPLAITQGKLKPYQIYYHNIVKS